MAKIPDNKAEYKKLERRLMKYVRQVLSIYDSSNLEAAKIALMSSYDALSEIPFKFDDYPELKDKVKKMLDNWMQDMKALIYAGTTAEWKNSNEIQDLLANGALSKYKATHNGKEYTKYYQTNSDALKAFQQRKDRGMNLSQKIWNQSAEYKQGLEAAISTAIQRGTSAITLSKQISKYLNDFKSMQKDYTEKFGHASDARDCEYKSIRLARNEINMAYRNAEQLRWQQMDFVVGFEIHLSHSHPEYDICDELQGKYPKTFKWSLWHVNCLCYRTSILKTEDEFWNDDPDTPSKNEVRDYPVAFKKWLYNNQERIGRAERRRTLPYFIKNNNEIIHGFIESGYSSISDIINKLKNKGILYLEPKRLSNPLTTDEIISRIGGRDLTLGSCSSLALAYAGNRFGFDVLDFRGGESADFFSNIDNIVNIAEIVGGMVTENTNDFIKAKKMMEIIEDGKEYYFACGEHATIIKKGKAGFEYLELQSPVNNGFKPFGKYEYRERFGMQESYTSSNGKKYKTKGCIIDLELLKQNKDFRTLLGYINTKPDMQEKGTNGFIK